MSTTTFIGLFLIIVAVIITDILCADVTKTQNPSNNAWPRLNNNSPNGSFVAPKWGPNSKTTTPWPALGSHRQNNQMNPSNTNQPSWVRPDNKPMWTQQPLPWAKPNNPLPNQQSNDNKPNQQTFVQNPSTGSRGNGNENTNKQSNGNTDDNELREFSEQLLTKDTNNAAKYVTINYQGMTSSRSMNDEAPQPLLSIKPPVYSIPTVEKLMLLYNNYIVEAHVNEVYTGQEKIEENNLLDTVLSTPVMQHTRNFLISKGKLGKDPKEFKDLLRQIWFNMYSRGGGKIGSSGFEHIFLAEIKNNQVSGLHNWLYFIEEEAKGQANYLGYLRKIDLGSKGAILKYHFNYHGIDKPVGSMFIGTSPELEMALYTTCFVLRADRVCPLRMNGNRFIIRTYTYRYRGKNLIGSAFPEI